MAWTSPLTMTSTTQSPPQSPTSPDAPVAKPGTPPPTYAESAQYYFPQSTSSLPITTQQPHTTFGPTPLALPEQQALLLPYYDARSAHSVAMATRRARWRFVGTLVWAIVVIAIVVILTGSGAEAWKWKRSNNS